MENEPYNNDLGIYEITLKKLKHTALCHIEKELWKDIKLNDAYIEFFLDPMIEGIIARFSNKIWAYGEGNHEFRWYKSWWQELRSKIFPKWYLRRFPSKFEVKEKFEILSTYPTLKLENEKHNAVLQFNSLFKK